MSTMPWRLFALGLLGRHRACWFRPSHLLNKLLLLSQLLRKLLLRKVLRQTTAATAESEPASATVAEEVAAEVSTPAAKVAPQTLQSGRIRVTLSNFGGIREVALLDKHPQELPTWRGGFGKDTDKSQPLPVISDQFNPRQFPAFKVAYPRAFFTGLSSFPWGVPGLERNLEAAMDPSVKKAQMRHRCK